MTNEYKPFKFIPGEGIDYGDGKKVYSLPFWARIRLHGYFRYSTLETKKETPKINENDLQGSTYLYSQLGERYARMLFKKPSWKRSEYPNKSTVNCKIEKNITAANIFETMFLLRDKKRGIRIPWQTERNFLYRESDGMLPYGHSNHFPLQFFVDGNFYFPKSVEQSDAINKASSASNKLKGHHHATI